MRGFAVRPDRLLLVLALCFGISTTSCPGQTHSSSGRAQTPFEFHSGFWINLHHFLYLEAVSERPQRGQHPATVNKADVDVRNSFSPEERAAWDAAVSYYASSVIQRDLLFDREMGAIKNQLEDAEAPPDL